MDDILKRSYKLNYGWFSKVFGVGKHRVVRLGRDAAPRRHFIPKRLHVVCTHALISALHVKLVC